jgi:hypothetical protein
MHALQRSTSPALVPLVMSCATGCISPLGASRPPLQLAADEGQLSTMAPTDSNVV